MAAYHRVTRNSEYPIDPAGKNRSTGSIAVAAARNFSRRAIADKGEDDRDAKLCLDSHPICVAAS